MTGSATFLNENPEDPFSPSRAVSAVLDPHGRITGWSARAEAVLGRPAREVMGQVAAGLLVAPEDRSSVDEAVAACRKQGGWSGVLRLRVGDGRTRRFGLRVWPLERSGGLTEWLVTGAPAAAVGQWEIDRSVVDGLFSRSPIGLAVHAPDLRILRINRALAGIAGIRAEDARGARIGHFLVAGDAETIEARLRLVLETGEPLIFTEQPCRLLTEPSRERLVAVSAFRMEDADGRVLGVTQLVEDVTDRHRARRRLALLSAAGAGIGTTLDVATTADELASAAVPGVADHASVDLLEQVSRGGGAGRRRGRRAGAQNGAARRAVGA